MPTVLPTVHVESLQTLAAIVALLSTTGVWTLLKRRGGSWKLAAGLVLVGLGALLGLAVFLPTGWKLPVPEQVLSVLLGLAGFSLLLWALLWGETNLAARASNKPEDDPEDAEPPDPVWLELAKEMRATLEHPYRDIILGEEGDEPDRGSLFGVFISCLKNPGHSILRKKENWNDKDKKRVKRREPVYAAWRQALDGWQGDKAYEKFLTATEDLEQPFTREQFEAAREHFVEAVRQACLLNEWMILWRSQHIGVQVGSVHQWHRDFVEEGLVPFMEEVDSLERRVQVELGETSPLLEEGLGPFDYESARRRLPYLEPISTS